MVANKTQTPFSEGPDDSSAPAEDGHGTMPAAARRALEEARARQVEIDRKARAAGERGGRGGLDPVRYGDWEVKGIASDF